MVHQVYPYKQNDYAKTGTAGDDLLGSSNALLLCEITEGRVRPDDYSLTWSGNFCTMPSQPGAQDTIEGTTTVLYLLIAFLIILLTRNTKAVQSDIIRIYW
jgi:hypothetical protein